LENRAIVDHNKVTKWAEDDEEDSEESDQSSGSEDEQPQENEGAAAGSKQRQTSLETEKSKTDIFCMACHKLFKSINQWENHELSKKHKTELDKLKGQEKEIYFKKLKDIKKFINLEKHRQEEKRKKKLQQQEELEGQEREDGEVGQEKPENPENPEKKTGKTGNQRR